MFYGIASDKDGKSLMIQNLSDERINAIDEAKRFCRKNDLKFEGVYQYKNTRNQNGNILYKFHEYRKKHGELPQKYFEAW